jgi:hypothetical protein
MAKTHKFTSADIPPLRRGKGVYAEIVADFIAQGAQSMQVTVEGMKPATLRAGLRRALEGSEGVKLAQRGEETYLVRADRP